jgi:glycosyltransferase involved in cell wall biosynthesis/O-antigen/teichoic acid export membrane protein
MNSLLKWRNRLTIIALGGFSRLFNSFSNVIISFFIIRIQSGELWGELVSYMLILDFGFSIISWGATPYLVREFSLHPQAMKTDWSEVTSSRTLLLILFNVVLIFVPIKSSIRPYLMAWSVVRFLFQSLEPIMLTNRHFALSLLADVISVLSIVTLAFVVDKVTLEALLLCLCATMAFKATLFLFVYRNAISIVPVKISFFKQAFPFLLLSFSAMLQQRIDLYCVAYLLSKQETAIYQVFINFLIFAQFAASLLLSPYTKNIFRLTDSSFRRLEIKFMKLGLLLSLLSILCIFIIIKSLYHFDLSMWMYVMGYFYILMYYQYQLRNYKMGKLNKQMDVIAFAALCTALSFLVSFLAIPRFGIEGALGASLIAQVFYRVPSVSVITCTYNRAPLLAETIESVLLQTFCDFEYIIIDDGSTDNTKEIVSSFNDSRILYFYYNHSEGYLSLVRNHGLRLASGTYIAFLDSDDLWLPQTLQIQVDAIQQNPDVGFVFTDAMIYDKLKITRSSLYEKEGSFKGRVYEEYVQNKLIICTGSLLFKKNCLAITGYQDERLFSGDFDFTISLAYYFKAFIIYKPLLKIQKQERSHGSIINKQRIEGYFLTIKREFLKNHLSRASYKRITQKLSYKFGAELQQMGRSQWASYYFLRSISINPFHLRSWVKLIFLSVGKGAKKIKTFNPRF